MRIVLDTNIYLAALREGGFVFKLFRDLFKPRLGHAVYISPDIKNELEKKIIIWNHKGWTSSQATEDMHRIIDEFIHVTNPKETIDEIKLDPDDDKILECAVSAQADLIVTMDRDLLRLKRFRNIGIVHPKTLSFMFPQK